MGLIICRTGVPCLCVLLAFAYTLGIGAVGEATAASPCLGAPTTSADGATVRGSACADVIVVTSPRVRQVLGGDGNDVIFATPNVEDVDGGEGDDVIYGEPPEAEQAAISRMPGPVGRALRRANASDALATASLSEVKCEAGKSCYGGDGSQELVGSGGNDRIFGQRGNDVLKGNGGNDQLFGGVGDEFPADGSAGIAGGTGNDLLSGGLGTDKLNGNQESDLIRGDGTIDSLEDTGESGTDTLSFATAVTPGFHGSVSIAGFPADADSEDRGVYVRLDGAEACAGPEGPLEACNNDARYGGGSDDVNGGFENLIGSPFADVIVGSSVANRIDGGGGTDVIYGKEGDDVIYGGADGDYIKGEAGADTAYGQAGTNNCDVETANECSGTAESVTQRDRSKISAGFMVTSAPATLGWVQLYLAGSTGKDDVTVSLSLVSGIGHVVYTAQAGSAQFDLASGAKTPGCVYEATKVDCTLPKPADAITLAGIGGNDKLALTVTEQFWETTSPVLLGGEGNDELLASGYTEDMVVDGPGVGEDVLYAYGYDDALINNEGKDNLQGGNGNDLLLSASNCDGDMLQGAQSGLSDGSAVNSSSWAKLPAGAVVADLATGTAGNVYAGGPACSSGTLGTLANIDDLEGTSGNDLLYGDAKDNNMLGRLGKDELWGREGNDRLEAKDEIAEVGGGGPGTDSCVLDASDKFNGCP